MELASSKCDDLYTQTILDSGAGATFGAYRSSSRHWSGHNLQHSHGGQADNTGREYKGWHLSDSLMAEAKEKGWICD